MSEIFNLASEVKFDLGGQSSFGSKVVYLTKGLYTKEIVLISIKVSELWTFEILTWPRRSMITQAKSCIFD